VATDFRPSTSALAVLSLLGVGPLHPYGMQRLIKEWGKDQVINVGQRTGLYNTIRRLQEAGLIAVRQTERDQQYPERTVYELTDEGRQACLRWLADMLRTPKNEFPEFPAALSFAMLLSPDEILDLLGERAGRLAETIARLDEDLTTSSDTVPRWALLETEYQKAVAAAELAWCRSVLADLNSGALHWSEDLADMAQSYVAE
jgi:DNA-binding PadR family transcriptional regulator